MLQTVDGDEVYVVEFDTMPGLPITWATPEEEPYARCLDNALREQIITEPGKYAIKITHDAKGKKYQIARVV